MQASRMSPTPQQLQQLHAEFYQLLPTKCPKLTPTFYSKVWEWISSDNPTKALLKNRQDVFFKLCECELNKIFLTRTPGKLIIKIMGNLVYYNVLSQKKEQKIMLQYTTTGENLSFEALLESLQNPTSQKKTKPPTASSPHPPTGSTGRPPRYPTSSSRR